MPSMRAHAAWVVAGAALFVAGLVTSSIAIAWASIAASAVVLVWLGVATARAHRARSSSSRNRFTSNPPA